MIDIFAIEDGKDLILADSVVPKAANLASVQLGSLEYAPDFGIDLLYFIDNPIQFQNESFKTYLVESMAQNMINVTEANEVLEHLYSKLQFSVDANEDSEGFIV